MNEKINTIQFRQDMNRASERSFKRKLLDAGRVAWDDISEKSPLTKTGMAIGVLATAAAVGSYAAGLYTVEQKPSMTKYGNVDIELTDRGQDVVEGLQDVVHTIDDGIQFIIGE